MSAKKAVINLVESLEKIGWIDDVDIDSISNKEGVVGITTTYSETHFIVIRVSKFLGKSKYTTTLQSYAGKEPVEMYSINSNSLTECVSDVNLLENTMKKYEPKE